MTGFISATSRSSTWRVPPTGRPSLTDPGDDPEHSEKVNRSTRRSQGHVPVCRHHADGELGIGVEPLDGALLVLRVLGDR